MAQTAFSGVFSGQNPKDSKRCHSAICVELEAVFADKQKPDFASRSYYGLHMTLLLWWQVFYKSFL
jgi:hypothetical protein